MFLNLKSKRVESALQTHLKAHNHPKTQRDERPERSSKEHCERPNKKPVPNLIIKKQTASTALTTMQAGSSYSNVAHHYVIHRIDSIEKDTESIGKSVQKLDSQRSQRIANAYRKIKKQDISQRILTEQPQEEPPRKSQNRAHYAMNKKEIVTNFANNYIAITENEEQDYLQEKKNDRDGTNYFCKLLQLMIQVFRRPKGSVIKFRSQSSREAEINESLERSKRSNKNLKSKNKMLQGTQHSNNPDEPETLHDIFERFKESLQKAEQRSQALQHDMWMQVGALMKELYAEINYFMKDLQGKWLTEIDQRYEQYQKGLQMVVMEQAQMEQHCKRLEEALTIERNRNSILAQSLEELHNRTLYSSAFFNQLSFHFDLDSILREKIYEFAGEGNSFVDSRLESDSSFTLKDEFLNADFAFSKKQRKKA